MPEMYANKLYEKYLMRKLIVQAQEIMIKAKQNLPDVYDVLNESHEVIGELLSVRPTMEVDIENVIEDTIKDFNNTKNNIVSTGYENLDRFAGGLTKGEITIVISKSDNPETLNIDVQKAADSLLAFDVPKREIAKILSAMSTFSANEIYEKIKDS